MDKDKKKPEKARKRRYQPPKVVDEEIFERNVLMACNGNKSVDEGCADPRGS